MNPRSHLLLAGFVFAAVQAVLYWKIGVFTGLEAEKYIREGGLLVENGQLSDPKFWFYLPIILLTAFCKLTGLSWGFVVLAQVLLSGYALYCFYRLAQALGGRFCALLASLMLALFVPLQMWNFYLYSDSIFFSLFIIFLYVLQRDDARSLSAGWASPALLLLLCVTRPAGLLLLPAYIVYLLLKSRKQPGKLLLTAGASVLLLAAMFTAVTFMYTGGQADMDALKPFVEEHIICFVPQNPAGAGVTVAHTASPLHGLWYYIRHNPGHFTGMVARRLVSFFNLTRPHYSGTHNLAMMAAMAAVYLPAVWGFAVLWRQRNICFFIAAVLVLYPLGIAFQCDDWHSRFTMLIIPVCILLAALGIGRLFHIRLQNSSTA